MVGRAARAKRSPTRASRISRVPRSLWRRGHVPIALDPYPAQGFCGSAYTHIGPDPWNSGACTILLGFSIMGEVLRAGGGLRAAW